MAEPRPTKPSTRRKGPSGNKKMPRKKKIRIEPPPSNVKASPESAVKGETSVVGSTSSRGVYVGDLFSLLDTDTRLKIFHYLTWQDLAAAAPTSKTFRDDCNHPSLTQNEDRQLTVRFHTCSTFLCRKLVALHRAGKFDKYSRLKVVWVGSSLAAPSLVDVNDIRGPCELPRVTDLELSYEPAAEDDDNPAVVDDDNGAPNDGRTRTTAPELVLCLSMAQFLPNVRHLTISSSSAVAPGNRHPISPDAPRFLSYIRRSVESLTFRGQSSSPHLRGEAIGSPLRIRSIDLDDCVFDLTAERNMFRRSHALPTSEEMFGEHANGPHNRCIFEMYANTLERVSIRNAKYYADDAFETFLRDLEESSRQRILRRPVGTPSRSSVNEVRDVPQYGLIKFVRRATNLQWFRSDLTPDNVAMLQRERPDVTFE